MAEKERLQQEIQYYQDLIKSYQNGSSFSGPQKSYPKQISKPKVSNRYSLIKNSSAGKQGDVKIGLSQRSPRRIVIKPGSSSSKRTVLNPTQTSSKMGGVLSNAPASSTTTRLIVPPCKNPSVSQNLGHFGDITLPSSVPVLPSHKQVIKQNHKMELQSLKRKHQDEATSKVSQSKPSGSQFVWINSEILKNCAHIVAKSPISQSTRVSPQYVKSRYKLTKKNLPVQSPKTSLPVFKSKNDLQRVGKYKLVSRKSPSGLRLTMKISGDSIPSPYFTSNVRSPYVSPSPYISRSGKRVISRYKIRKRTSTSSIVHTGTSKRSIRSSPYKVDRRKRPALRTRYKIDKLDQTRKTLKFMTTPKKDRRSYKWVKQSLKRSYQHTFISPYKLLRHSHSPPVKGEAKPKSKDGNLLIRKLASHCLQKSVVVSMRAKYKKDRTNNKHCMFYMRFGRCKRGEKCYYIHDPDKVAVCTRYLRGTCNIENCVFSHEARKEKVPVCQHFLRGCCARDNCPYLHVNVGKDAPICTSFAEFRYCHLGEKCKKLHTDVCPNRDSQGSCSKGSKCRLRHPIKPTKPVASVKAKVQASTKSLTTDDITSSDESGVDNVVVSAGKQLTAALPTYISLSTLKAVPTDSSRELKKLKNKPNFL